MGFIPMWAPMAAFLGTYGNTPVPTPFGLAYSCHLMFCAHQRLLVDPTPLTRHRRICTAQNCASGDAVLRDDPIISLPPPDGPFGAFGTFGWQWCADDTFDENMLSLAYASRLNGFKLARQYATGRCSVLFCRRPRQMGIGKRMSIEVVGFGINAPPNFAAVAATSSANGARRGNVQRSDLMVMEAGIRNTQNEIHSEVQAVARCARAGISLKGCWAYVALLPCWECAKILAAAGIARVVFTSSWARNRKDPGLRQRFLAEASGMDWVPTRLSQEREAYIDGLWQAWKAERGLDRAGIKALGSHCPI